MKQRLSFLSICAVLLVTGALFSSCTQTSTPGTASQGTPVLSIAGATTLDVTGLSDNQLYEFTVAGTTSGATITGFSSYANGTIKVSWTRGSGDTGIDTVFYRTTSSTTAASGYNVWATAVVSGPFRIYETADNTAGHNSGLVLGPTTKTVSIGGADSTNADLILETYNVSGTTLPFLSLDAGDVLFGTTTHKTRFATNPFAVAGGLANQHSLTDVTSTFPTVANEVTVFTDFASTKSKSIVLVGRTGSNNYVRVEVVPQSNGNLWGDTGGANSKRFIDVNVAYQPSAGWGYVARPPAFSKGLAKRVATGAAIQQ